MKPMRAFVIRNADIKQRTIDYIESLPADELFDVIIKKHDPKRTIEQNRMAHLIVTAISEQVTNDEGELLPMPSWWFQLKMEFFGYAELELPNGSFVSVEPQSRNRGTKAFSAWIEWLFAQAATRWNEPVVLPAEAHELRALGRG